MDVDAFILWQGHFTEIMPISPFFNVTSKDATYMHQIFKVNKHGFFPCIICKNLRMQCVRLQIVQVHFFNHHTTLLLLVPMCQESLLLSGKQWKWARISGYAR
jgi:hypothetical protein